MLIKPTDLLLLDEPTNHLDVKSIEWLASYIKNSDGTTVIVSHDRYFLDETVNQIIEIDQKSFIFIMEIIHILLKKETKDC